MAIKIKEIYGYQILYDERLKRFIIEDSDGTELGFGSTQDEAEEKAKVLSKQEFKRISVVEVRRGGEVVMGQLTSLNKDDRSAWVSMEPRSGHRRGEREKIHLRSGTGYYEATITNLQIVETVKEKGVELQKVEAEIKSLIDILEKPINLDYFGLTKYD